MIALYRPGHSPLHRLPAGAKLAGMVVLALAISAWPHTIWTAVGAFAGVALLYLLGGLGVTGFAVQLWRAKWIVVILVATQAIFVSWEAAAIGTVRVVAIVLLAALVTTTTPTGAMLDAIERALRPLRRVGVDPVRVAFLLSLTIAVLPVIAGLAAQVREAQRARGVRLGPHAIVTLLVLALRHADQVGEALTARGDLHTA